MDSSRALLSFLKALADGNRLRIAGLLAHRPHSVEELAEVLGIRASTISHHLSVLRGAGAVTGAVQGHYHVYDLDRAALASRAAELTPERLSDLARPAAGLDPYERKVLSTFLDDDGRLRAQPAKRKKFQVILRHALRRFFQQDSGPWAEPEVNRRLYALTADVAAIRRGFVDHAYMARTPGGTEYTLTERGARLDW